MTMTVLKDDDGGGGSGGDFDDFYARSRLECMRSLSLSLPLVVL